MKRNNFIFLLPILFTVACQPQADRFTLNGEIVDADGKMLYLDHLGLDMIEVIDSVKLDVQGQFSFTPTAPLDCFDFYRIRVDNKVINLSIDSTETITIKGNLQNLNTDYLVEGSQNCSLLKELVLRQMDLLSDLRSISARYNGVNATQIQQEIDELVSVFKSELMSEYILPNPSSPVAYYTLFMSINGSTLFQPRTDRQDAKCYAAVATQMDMHYPHSVRTAHLHNVAMKSMAKTTPPRKTVTDEEVVQFESLIEETGLIEIELPDYKGQMHKLSDEKGKVVLLDFTAYKTKYSPNYNIMLGELYDKYAERGFSIYQISFDNDESFWLNTAPNLSWTCVRDEAGANSMYLTMYNVKQLPAVFLIDRDGNIVDRPAEALELDSKIAKLLQ